MAMRRGRAWLEAFALALGLHGAVSQGDDVPVQGLFWRCDVLVLGVEYSAITEQQMADLSDSYVDAVQEIMNVSDLVVTSLDGCMDSISISPRDLIHMHGVTLSFAVRSAELLTGRSVYDALWSDAGFAGIRGATRAVLAPRANLTWSNITDAALQAFDKDGDGRLESPELRSFARNFTDDSVTGWDNETLWDRSYEEWRHFIGNYGLARRRRSHAEKRAWQEALAEFNATHEDWENISNVTREDLGFNFTASNKDFLTELVQNDLMHIVLGGYHLEHAACKLGVLTDRSGEEIDCNLPAAVLIDQGGGDLIRVQPLMAEDGQLLNVPMKESAACGPPISAQDAIAGESEEGAAWDDLGTEFIAAADAPVQGGAAVAAAPPQPTDDAGIFGAVNLTHVAGKFEAHARATLGFAASKASEVSPNNVAAVLAIAAGSTVLLAVLAAGECRCQRRQLFCSVARGLVASYGPLPELSGAALPVNVDSAA